MKLSAKNKITILAISGSLRETSSNTAVIKVAAAYVDKKIRFINYNGLGTIPPFDGSTNAPAPVKKFRKLLQQADGVLVCAPEYAFGVSGVLKNAIDWTVSSGEFADKPTALITAATSGDKAHAAMLLTLSALSACVPDSSSLLISYVRSKMDEQNNIKDDETKQAICSIVDSLTADIAYHLM